MAEKKPAPKLSPEDVLFPKEDRDRVMEAGRQFLKEASGDERKYLSTIIEKELSARGSSKEVLKERTDQIVEDLLRQNGNGEDRKLSVEDIIRPLQEEKILGLTNIVPEESIRKPSRAHAKKRGNLADVAPIDPVSEIAETSKNAADQLEASTAPRAAHLEQVEKDLYPRKLDRAVVHAEALLGSMSHVGAWQATREWLAEQGEKDIEELSLDLAVRLAEKRREGAIAAGATPEDADRKFRRDPLLRAAGIKLEGPERPERENPRPPLAVEQATAAKEKPASPEGGEVEESDRLDAAQELLSALDRGATWDQALDAATEQLTAKFPSMSSAERARLRLDVLGTVTDDRRPDISFVRKVAEEYNQALKNVPAAPQSEAPVKPEPVPSVEPAPVRAEEESGGVYTPPPFVDVDTADIRMPSSTPEAVDASIRSKNTVRVKDVFSEEVSPEKAVPLEKLETAEKVVPLEDTAEGEPDRADFEGTEEQWGAYLEKSRGGNTVPPPEKKVSTPRAKRERKETTTKRPIGFNFESKKETPPGPERVREGIAQEKQQNEKRFAELGYLDKLRKIGSDYRKIPLKKKLGFAALCYAAGTAGALVGGMPGLALIGGAAVGRGLQRLGSTAATFLAVEGGLRSAFEKTTGGKVRGWRDTFSILAGGALAGMTAMGWTGEAVKHYGTPLWESVKEYFLDAKDLATGTSRHVVEGATVERYEQLVRDLEGRKAASEAANKTIGELHDASGKAARGVETVVEDAFKKAGVQAAREEAAQKAIADIKAALGAIPGKLKGTVGGVNANILRVSESLSDTSGLEAPELEYTKDGILVPKMAEAVLDKSASVASTRKVIDALVGAGLSGRGELIAGIEPRLESLARELSTKEVQEYILAEKARIAEQLAGMEALSPEGQEELRRELKYKASILSRLAQLETNEGSGALAAAKKELIEEKVQKTASKGVKAAAKKAVVEPPKEPSFVAEPWKEEAAPEDSPVERPDAEEEYEEAEADDEPAPRKITPGERLIALREEAERAAARSGGADASDVESLKAGDSVNIDELKNEKIGRGFSGYPGSIGGAWEQVKDLDANKVMQEGTRRFWSPFTKVGKAAKVLKDVMAETRLRPAVGESVDQFINRALGNR